MLRYVCVLSPTALRTQVVEVDYKLVQYNTLFVSFD